VPSVGDTPCVGVHLSLDINLCCLKDHADQNKQHGSEAGFEYSSARFSGSDLI
jgi:hypothetical protein